MKKTVILGILLSFSGLFYAEMPEVNGDFFNGTGTVLHANNINNPKNVNGENSLSYTYTDSYGVFHTVSSYNSFWLKIVFLP